jgi:hypothetical protein
MQLLENTLANRNLIFIFSGNRQLTDAMRLGPSSSSHWMESRRDRSGIIVDVDVEALFQSMKKDYRLKLPVIE